MASVTKKLFCIYIVCIAPTPLVPSQLHKTVLFSPTGPPEYRFSPEFLHFTFTILQSNYDFTWIIYM